MLQVQILVDTENVKISDRLKRHVNRRMKRKRHETIEAPTYSTDDEDTIYSIEDEEELEDEDGERERMEGEDSNFELKKVDVTESEINQNG